LGHKKIILDLVFGAVIPLLILKYGTLHLHLPARPAYILAGLIPAAYVVWDVLFYTKRFNAITTLVAITAVTQGGLAFLKVDGWRYALQDSMSAVVMILVFAGTLVAGKPILNYFIVQILEPQTPEEVQLAWTLLRQKPVHRMLVYGTLVLIADHLLRGSLNYYLAVTRVTATFGTDEFNQQKAHVESLTRFLFPAMAIGSMVAAYALVSRAIDHWLGDSADDGGTLFEQITRRLSPVGEKGAGKAAPASVPV
jgi:hypothetical protein